MRRKFYACKKLQFTGKMYERGEQWKKDKLDASLRILAVEVLSKMMVTHDKEGLTNIH